jgi:hypothetical protein
MNLNLDTWTPSALLLLYEALIEAAETGEPGEHAAQACEVMEKYNHLMGDGTEQ